jgi:hypothetical protein
MSNYVHPIYEVEHAQLRKAIKDLRVQADLCYSQVEHCADAHMAWDILEDQIQAKIDRCKAIRNASLKIKD